MSGHRDVLLVEDEAPIADLLRRVLVRAGYTVRIAADGVQALAALKDDAPAVLVLDMVLPGLSGFTILEHLHRQQITMPTVVITANPLYHETLHIAGIRHVLIKPFRIEELLEALATTTGFSTTP